MSDVCIVRPNGIDRAAQTLYSWAQDTVNDMTSSLHSLHADLTGSTASRSNVNSELSNCQAFFFFGHGDWDKLLNGQVAVVDAQNIGRAAQGLIIIAIACKSAHTLGDSAVNAGVRGYLGFDEDLAWVIGVSDQWTGQACAAGPRHLLIGQGTLSNAADAMRQKFDSAIGYFKYYGGKSNANATLAYLWANWSKNHICIKGDPNATL